jgi:colicin import membrane protein
MGFLREYRTPLIGAAALHAGLLLIAALASLQWVRQQPPVQLAIEATVVDASALPPSRKAPGPVAKPAPPAPEAAAAPETGLKREREAAAERQRLEQAELQRQAKASAKARAAAEAKAVAEAAEAAAAKAQAQAAAQAKAQAEAAAAAKAAAAAQAKASAEARQREQAAAAERQRREQLLAREAADGAQAEREAELRRRLAAEEEEAAGASAAQPGLLDEYRAALVQVIERNWIKPVTARSGLECVLLVDQAQGGTVLAVRIGRCNGDEAVRESIVTAVHRASPLPLPRDPRAFQRRLEIVFKPTE